LPQKQITWGLYLFWLERNQRPPLYILVSRVTKKLTGIIVAMVTKWNGAVKVKWFKIEHYMATWRHKISPLVLKNVSFVCCTHSWNIFEHLKINFVFCNILYVFFQKKKTTSTLHLSKFTGIFTPVRVTVERWHLELWSKMKNSLRCWEFEIAYREWLKSIS